MQWERNWKINEEWEERSVKKEREKKWKTKENQEQMTLKIKW